MIQEDPVFTAMVFLRERLDKAQTQRIELLRTYKGLTLTPNIQKEIADLGLLIKEIQNQINYIKG